ncbi:hypothetical protein HID58_071413 [Brassica napus]|uniref:Uncharacterized protein n=1 Tax=Brassica napus TaxID=3708 RepID=A0ABQ7Z1I3_BRANA|nr:hypothetical protein HID58_071413 [Brassica napus]
MLFDTYFNIFLFLQMHVASLIAVYANWGLTKVRGIRWVWAGVWLYSIIHLDGKAWLNLFENKTAFKRKKDYEKKKKERERERGSIWALAQRTLHELSESAEQAKRRTEIARQYKPLSQLRKLHTHWGHVESVVGLVTKSWTIASEARNSSRQIL